MQWPSFTLILTKIFLLYVIYIIYNLSLLFVTPSCDKSQRCLTSYLSKKPQLQLQVYSSVNKYPNQYQELDFVYANENFNYTHPSSYPLTLNIRRKTRNNGTLFLHIIVAPSSRKFDKSIINIGKDPYVSYIVIKMTQYTIPKAETFNLLGEKNNALRNKQSLIDPIAHIKSHVTFTIMTNDISLPMHNIPMELINQLKIIHGRTFLPIVNYDFLQTRHSNLMQIMPHNNTINITLQYSPISIGKLRLLLHVEVTLPKLKSLGFSDKDVDEIKAIFADINIYILGGTFFIATIHLLFDFLAFKNDISYWRRKDNLVGLSKWTVVWRGFSQTIVFLYLLDNGSSLLVLIPTGIGSIIEMWKLKKVLKLRLKNNNIKNVAEVRTREFDAESMHYLSYLLYPLVIGGAIYSLLFIPHKSWYSWTLNSLVPGVYAFGFLFMLPQLFVNYKLKSVAHLPWRTFMYKAFNTFIDDVFVFIIDTPAAYRVACFRDDAVFLIYLYQRWLYPVDRSRLDVDVITEEAVDFGKSNKMD
ncbi:Cleft lip and palate transmembrane protein 1-like protein [Eufriesea mexicana]|uniref:Lipid scramblase CLPTM1L n=1 Tax=Eufriesea mexicana TaxID=516756 RepID=A0A310S8M1_9HYME|nr:PREDICTED: cleft lip and palate transmembrane protein 1-like protein [Eufriesea mexicana]OAD52988.1 Cleft lip and palate transmembrane protein 1-like protein [Eufriesea mexicana]